MNGEAIAKSTRLAWKLALGGGAAIVLAALLEVAGVSAGLSAVRVLLTCAGALAIGIALYVRTMHVGLLVFACFAAILARFGFPIEWDSGRILSGFGAIVAGLGAVFVALPSHYRKLLASGLMVLHFGGILAAVTSPGSQPWLSATIGVLLYRPYLQCVYLTNAYHFYSPEPGPASQVWFCIRYKPDANGVVGTRWHKFPRRPEDMFDPLALSYYRRLSLTMQLENRQPSIVTDDMKRVRILLGQGENGIRLHPGYVPIENQHRMPSDAVRDFVLPSYIRHVANDPENQHDDGKTEIDTIKVYCVEHRILGPTDLQLGYTPYDPSTYIPYYYGEFKPDGRLANPNDPLLYWMIPIFWEPNPKKGDIPPWHNFKTHPDEFILIDNVIRHCGGSDHNVRSDDDVSAANKKR